MAPTEYSSVFENAIHCSTALQLERRLQIRRLNQMHLGGQFKTLIPFLTSTYQSQIELYQRLIIISTAMLSEPKPGVDYGKLAAEVPEIQAKLEFLDKAIFEVVPLVAATLIDPKPDSKNYVNHLLISQAEKASLVSDIDRDFGKWMYEKNPDYSSAAAKILKTFLEEKGFKCSDEPWE
ncbi:MAG: hypothetical protein CXZ00_07960 [Acidobacteria bacterium]|nr:MAG: hypothetical protein CXZ00_07960 [Acidobacteriota bacterium]